MSWETRTKIGRQALFELSKENDFTINLKGSEWNNPQFFISIKSIKYPKVLKSIKFDIKKLSILNSYKIDTVINSITEDEKQIIKQSGNTTVYANNCYGFKLEWGGGTDTSSWVECDYSIKIKSSNGYNKSVPAIHEYVIYRYDMDLYGGLGYGDTFVESFDNIDNYTITPVVNNTNFSNSYSWNFVLTKYINKTYIDQDIVLLVMVIENTTINNKRNIEYNENKASWVDISKLYFKSQVIQLEKLEKILLNLSLYTKNISWKNSNLIIGATSLFTKNNNGFYNLEYSKKDNYNYEIVNRSLSYPTKVTLTNSNRILKYDRNDGTFPSSYTINTKEDFNLYIWVEHEVLNQADNGYFTIDVYNNGLLVDTLKNNYKWLESNYIAKAFEWGRSYSWFYSSYYFNIKADKNGTNNITVKRTWSDGSTMSIWVYVNKGSNYIDTSKEVITYNDTLIYAFENNEEE